MEQPSDALRPTWQQPPTEINALTLMLFAQFGAILTIASWFLPNELSDLEAPVILLLIGMTGIGLLQLFRVRHGRLLTYPLIALLAVSWVLLGEFDLEDAVFVTVFMSFTFSFLLYLPALGFDELGLKLSRPRRKLLLLVMLTIFATVWFGMDALEYGISGEAGVWDEALDEDVIVALSTAEFGAAAGAAVLFVAGVLGVVLIGGFGIQLGPVKPEHAAFGLAVGNGLMVLFWILLEEDPSIEAVLDAAAIGGLMFLPVLGFFRQQPAAGDTATPAGESTAAAEEATV